MKIKNQEFLKSSAAGDFGRYRVLARLGHGGMADVCLALVRGPARICKLVVLKRVLPHLAEDPEFLTMFLDEAQLAARLNHPNIVQTNEVGYEDDRCFMTMEYLEGQPLSRILRKVGRDGLPLALHVRLIADALAGLHHAHTLADYDGSPLGVVHRDVTPQNVFVTYDGVVKVVDFGIAKASCSQSETRAGVFKGKVGYMAPEQARGEIVDLRADIFAAGVMLWEAAAGFRPWAGRPENVVLKLIREGWFPPIADFAPAAPERLQAIIAKALSPNREDRHGSAAELQEALESFLDEIGETPRERDLGELVAGAFAEDRSKIKAIIAEQISAYEAGATPDRLPILDPPTADGAGSGSASDIEVPSVSGARISKRAPPPARSTRRFAWMAGGAALMAATLCVMFCVLPGGVGGAPIRAIEAAEPARAPVAPPAAPSADARPQAPAVESAPKAVAAAPEERRDDVATRGPNDGQPRPAFARRAPRGQRSLDTTNPYADAR